MLIPIAFVLAFVAVVVIAQTVAGLAFSSRDRARHVNKRLTLLNQGMSSEQVYTALVRRPDGGRFAAAAPGLYDRVAVYCRQAGLSMSLQRLAAFVAGGALVLWLFAMVMLGALGGRSLAANAILSLLGASALAAVAAFVWVSGRRTKRLKQIEEQMPLALDIVIRAIRAGHPVISAVQLAAEEMGDPIGSEFGLIVDETTYGLEFREALINLAHRTGSQDAHYFAVSVGIQSETGGNLAEILTNLASVIRGRQTLRLRVKALASEGQMSAHILSALPVLIVAFILLTQPGFYISKVGDPIFWPTVFGVVAVYALGQLIIRRIVNFRY